MDKEKKYYKGEKYIYLLMAVRLCQKAGMRKNTDFSELAIIGNDNGMTGGYNYYRKFSLQKHDNKWLLNEYKSSRGFAEYCRTFQIGYNLDDIKAQAPSISDYIDEYGDNCGQNWEH